MTPRDVTPEPAVLELAREWLAHATAKLPGRGSQPAIPIAMVSALLSEVERLRSLVETAQRDVVLMAQSKIGERCEHHRLPLDVLEYHATRECPLCWKAAAEEASAELSRRRAVPPATPPADTLSALRSILLEPEMPQTDEALIQAARNVCANEEHYRDLVGPPAAEQEPPQMDDLKFLDMINNPPVGGQFHWRDNYYFQRTLLGAVLVTLPDRSQKVIPPNEWASIVAHVSKTGETAESYAVALASTVTTSDDRRDARAGANVSRVAIDHLADACASDPKADPSCPRCQAALRRRTRWKESGR